MKNNSYLPVTAREINAGDSVRRAMASLIVMGVIALLGCILLASSDSSHTVTNAISDALFFIGFFCPLGSFTCGVIYRRLQRKSAGHP